MPAEGAKAEALQRYPALGVANSPFNQEFLRLYQDANARGDTLLQQPNWPMALAAQAAKTVPQPMPQPTPFPGSVSLLAITTDIQKYAGKPVLVTAWIELSTSFVDVFEDQSGVFFAFSTRGDGGYIHIYGSKCAPSVEKLRSQLLEKRGKPLFAALKIVPLEPMTPIIYAAHLLEVYPPRQRVNSSLSDNPNGTRPIPLRSRSVSLQRRLGSGGLGVANMVAGSWYSRQVCDP